jgi:myo-inositol-1(or 4)-monophosphatase
LTFEPEADLGIAVRAAREAGVVVMQYFRTDLDVVMKSPDQPVTKADLAADALLKEILRGLRPDYGWLSEETADTTDRLDREYVWMVDPIDGTRSFISGRAEFSISIGLTYNGEPVLGVVYNPATDEMYTAIKGRGAFAGDRPMKVGGGRDRGVMVASRSEIKRGHFKPFEAVFDIQGLGSTAYKLCKVAEGQVDVFLSRGPKGEWDLCGSDVIVTEAGGTITDLEGRRLQYNRPDPHIKGVVAARAEVHVDLVNQMKDLNG